MKVGDYVRTKKGEIGKIIGYIDEPTDFYFNCYVTTLKTNFTDTYITEYNPNIISSPRKLDLIQEGDYVNGARVINISKEQGKNIELYLDTNDLFEQNIYKNEDIKSIVTKEQFSSMEYKTNDSK